MLQIHGLSGQPQTATIHAMAVCRGLGGQTADRLLRLATVKRLGAHEVVFHEGDPADTTFEVIQGVLKLYKLMPDGRRQITGFLYPGDILGLAFVGIYPFTAEAVTSVTLSRLPRARLEAMVEEVPQLACRLLMLARGELVDAQEQMLLLGRKSPLEKVASFLMRLSERNAEQDGDAEEVYLPMSRTDIADYLGLTIETVSRSFTRLRTAGIIALPRSSHVVLRDLDRLADLAQGGDWSDAGHDKAGHPPKHTRSAAASMELC